MTMYQRRTDPDNGTTSPSRQKPKRGMTPAQIAEREAAYLYHLRDTQGDDFTALTRAGYQPKDRNDAKSMAHQIRTRINEHADVKSVFIAAGMGLIEWVLALDWLMQQDPKWRAVAHKSWGLAIGAYSQQDSRPGAAINVNVLQHGDPTQPHSSPGVVQIAIDARRPPAEYPPQLSASDS